MIVTMIVMMIRATVLAGEGAPKLEVNPPDLLLLLVLLILLLIFSTSRATQRDLLAAQLCIWVFGLLAL